MSLGKVWYTWYGVACQIVCMCRLRVTTWILQATILQSQLKHLSISIYISGTDTGGRHDGQESYLAWLCSETRLEA